MKLWHPNFWLSQTFQNKNNISILSIFLRQIVFAPWFISNKNIPKDLKIQTVIKLEEIRYFSFHSKLFNHPNPPKGLHPTFTTILHVN